MLDLAYVLGSVSFFGLMLFYTHACDRLGARPDGERGQS